MELGGGLFKAMNSWSKDLEKGQSMLDLFGTFEDLTAWIMASEQS